MACPHRRLLAYGQSINGIFHAGSFVLTDPRAGRPPTPADGELLRKLLVRLHETGCCLRRIGNRGEPFAMDGSTVNRRRHPWLAAEPASLRPAHGARPLPARRVPRGPAMSGPEPVGGTLVAVGPRLSPRPAAPTTGPSSPARTGSTGSCRWKSPTDCSRSRAGRSPAGR